jgi:hypothetical protein
MSCINFMQGGNREPRLIRALDEGPNIGLTVGYSGDDQWLRSQNGITSLKKARTLNEKGLPCAFPLYTSS